MTIFLFQCPIPHWCGVCVAKRAFSRFFGHFSPKKMTKRRERFRSTVALPVLFCDLGRCTKAGARA